MDKDKFDTFLRRNINMNHIVFLSGGNASFAVAAWVKEQYGHLKGHSILLYFTDVKWEDFDLYRFIIDASNRLELPMLIHSRGLTPPQLMVKQKFMANSRVGSCSKELKMKVASDYIKKGIKPEIEVWHNKKYIKTDDFISNATLYFGIGVNELHREEPIKINWAPYEVVNPLIYHDINIDESLRKYSILPGQLYSKGFHHNNCGGKCIKGGQAHFKNLFMKDEKSFIELMEQEIVISDYIRYTKQPAIKSGKCKDYMYKDVWEFVSTGEKSAKIQHIIDTHPYTKNWRFGKNRHGEDIKKPFTFMKTKSLYELKQQPMQYDIFDYGACGCFVELDTAAG